MDVSRQHRDQIEAAIERGGRLSLALDVAWLVMIIVGVMMLVAVSFGL